MNASVSTAPFVLLRTYFSAKIYTSFFLMIKNLEFRKLTDLQTQYYEFEFDDFVTDIPYALQI